MPFLCEGAYRRSSNSACIEENEMDLLFIGLTILFFALSGWLISLLEKL